MLIREAGNSSQPIKAINLGVWNGLHSLSSATKYPKIPIAMDANHCFKSEKKVNFIKIEEILPILEEFVLYYSIYRQQ